MRMQNAWLLRRRTLVPLQSTSKVIICSISAIWMHAFPFQHCCRRFHKLGFLLSGMHMRLSSSNILRWNCVIHVHTLHARCLCICGLYNYICIWFSQDCTLRTCCRILVTRNTGCQSCPRGLLKTCSMLESFRICSTVRSAKSHWNCGVYQCSIALQAIQAVNSRHKGWIWGTCSVCWPFRCGATPTRYLLGRVRLSQSVLGCGFAFLAEEYPRHWRQLDLLMSSRFHKALAVSGEARDFMGRMLLSEVYLRAFPTSSGCHLEIVVLVYCCIF